MLFADAVPPPPPTPVEATSTTKDTTPNPRGAVGSPDFIVYSLVFAGILLVAAVIFVFFDRWRKKPTGESARDFSMSLSSFKELYENGEITEAEYERIKAKWAAKLREKTGVPVAPPPEPPPPAAPPLSPSLPFPLGMPTVPPPPPPPPNTRRTE